MKKKGQITEDSNFFLPLSLLGTKINFQSGIYFLCHFGSLIIIGMSLRDKNNKPFPFIILDNQFQAGFKDGFELIKILVKWKKKMLFNISSIILSNSYLER